MGYCFINHTYHAKQISSSNTMYSVFSKLSVVLGAISPSPKTDTVFCHIPAINVMPSWDDTISTYANDGDSIEMNIYPITSESINKFHKDFPSAHVPNSFQKFLIRPKIDSAEATPINTPINTPTSPRTKISRIGDMVLGRAFNVAIANKPPCSYTQSLQHLIWIKTGDVKKDIPALWYKCSFNSNNKVEPVTILYCHDCGEDLGLISGSLELLCETMHCNILAFEYPSYGLYNHSYSDELLSKNADYVYLYLTGLLEKPSNRLIIVGKGIGSAVALVLGRAKHKVKKHTDIAAGIILISPKMDPSAFGYKGIFENSKTIKSVKLPVFGIYGELDKFASCAKKLESYLKSTHQFVSIPDGNDDIEIRHYDEYSESISTFITKMFPEFSSLFSGAALEKMKPTEFSQSPIDVIREILTTIGLERYTETFICFGYMCIEDLQTMGDEEVEMIGLSAKDGKKLLEFIKVGTKNVKESRKSPTKKRSDSATETTGLQLSLTTSSHGQQEDFKPLTPRF
ncbi:SAM domain-containing protein [Entamoeba marina]